MTKINPSTPDSKKQSKNENQPDQRKTKGKGNRPTIRSIGNSTSKPERPKDQEEKHKEGNRKEVPQSHLQPQTHSAMLCYKLFSTDSEHAEAREKRIARRGEGRRSCSSRRSRDREAVGRSIAIKDSDSYRGRDSKLIAE